MANDDLIRDLARRSVQGLELEPTAVLSDALLETDRPDLGEDLALVLANKKPFPLAKRGRMYTKREREDRERALSVIFRRIHRRFAWSREDQRDVEHALGELREIGRNWNEAFARGGMTRAARPRRGNDEHRVRADIELMRRSPRKGTA